MARDQTRGQVLGQVLGLLLGLVLGQGDVTWLCYMVLVKVLLQWCCLLVLVHGGELIGTLTIRHPANNALSWSPSKNHI